MNLQIDVRLLLNKAALEINYLCINGGTPMIFYFS